MSDINNEKKNIAFAFDRIATCYDRANRFISFGMDIRWRRRMVDKIPDGKPIKVLDVACGTCDSSIVVVERKSNIEKLVGLDASEGMLAIGRKKIEAKKIEKIELVKGDMLGLPFDEGDFDCVTIVFGLRNAPDTAKAISEAARVVKAGGRCLFLEFSMPENVLFRSFHYVYLRFLMPVLAFLVSGKYQAYKYLFRSVDEFYKPGEVLTMMENVGLESKVESLAGGAVWLYEGVKV